MVIQALTPDDVIHEFPDGTPDSVIDNAIQAHINPPPSLMQNIGNDMSSHMENIGKSQLYGLKGEQTAPETALQNMGDIAGAAWDVPVEAAKSAWGDVPQKIADSIGGNEYGKKAADLLMSTVDPIKEKASEYAQNHPRIARNVEALANVLGMGGTPEAAGAVLKPVNAVGDIVYDSGKASQDAAHMKYVQDMVLPKQTPTVKADMAMRTVQQDGPLARNVYQPTTQEQQMAQTIGEIPGIGRGNSLQKNLNLIQNANQKEAESLKDILKNNDVPISDDTVLNTLSTVRQNLAGNPYISGADGAKAADNIVNKALDIITSKPQTASSMLDARKELDAFVSSQKGDKTFNPALDSPISTAVQQVRQAMNNMVAEAVPKAEVLKSLQKQSSLYAAADNIAPKAAGESATKIGRIIQAVKPHNFGEAAGGAGALAGAGAAIHYLPPSALAAALMGYGAYKGVTAPATRISIGKSLGGGR